MRELTPRELQLVAGGNAAATADGPYPFPPWPQPPLPPVPPFPPWPPWPEPWPPVPGPTPRY